MPQGEAFKLGIADRTAPVRQNLAPPRLELLNGAEPLDLDPADRFLVVRDPSERVQELGLTAVGVDQIEKDASLKPRKFPGRTRCGTLFSTSSELPIRVRDGSCITQT